MNNDEPIVIAPVEHSRSTEKQKPVGSKYFTYADTTGQTHSPQQSAPGTDPVTSTAHTIPDQPQAKPQAQPKSRLTGLAQVVGGGACTLIGIPMLILPGPGLLAIGGGVYLMARGAKTLLGPR